LATLQDADEPKIKNREAFDSLFLFVLAAQPQRGR
jgi:hypothetical protein